MPDPIKTEDDTEVVATPTPAAPEADQTPAPVNDDPDAIELAEALAALEAEEAGSEEPKQETGQGSEDPPAIPKPKEEPAPPPPEKGETPMIPKPRFDEVSQRATEAEQQAAYWRGVAEARQQQTGAPPASTEPPKPTPEDRLAQIQSEQDTLAAKYDDGELTMAEYKAAERKLNGQEQAIREEVILSKVKPAPAPPSGEDDAYLDDLTAKIEQAHPWVSVFEQAGTDADWNVVKQAAISNLVEQGIDPTKGTRGKIALREEIAVLIDSYGPILVGERAKAKGIEIPAASAPAQQQPKPGELSPEAKARQAKLSQQSGAPPDVTAMGGQSRSSTAEPGEAEINEMTDEEISQLPVAVKNRLLGITT